MFKSLLGCVLAAIFLLIPLQAFSAVETPEIFKEAKQLSLTGILRLPTNEGDCKAWILKVEVSNIEVYYLVYCETHKTIQIAQQIGPNMGILVYSEETGSTQIVAIYYGSILDKQDISLDVAITTAKELLDKVRPNLKKLPKGMVLPISLSTTDKVIIEKDIEAIDRAIELAMSSKETVKEYGLDVKVWKKGGLGLGGQWYFYTIKYALDLKSLVVIIYQPELGEVFIVRVDPDPRRFNYTVYTLKDHNAGVWSFYNIGRDAANGLINSMLNTMSFLSNTFEFEPTGEMREDLCWKLEIEK
jgi:hypothetical protein